jgi:hypothetical protein
MESVLLDNVLSLRAQQIMQVSHGGTIHRTTKKAAGLEGTAFPLLLATDIGNKEALRLKTLSLCTPVHAVYTQEGSAHCVIVVDVE